MCSALTRQIIMGLGHNFAHSRQLICRDIRKIVTWLKELNRNLIKINFHNITFMSSQTVSEIVPSYTKAFGHWQWRWVGAGQNGPASVMTWKLDAWRGSRTYGYHFKCDDNHREKVINVHALGSFCVCTQPMGTHYSVTPSLIGWAHTHNVACTLPRRIVVHS